MKLTALLIAAMLAPLPALAQGPTYLPAPTNAGLPAVTDAAQRAATARIKPKKIILVGDSTMQVGSGWGGVFCSNHVMSILSCLDLGRGGRGTFDYRAEGSWDLALNEMRTPGYSAVYVLIQFGHNDQPGKPGRSTDLTSEYGPNLRRYVTEARAAGAIPVLVTPLTRRSFKAGSLQDNLNAWAQATRTVAREMNAPLVDLHALSIAAVQKMGAVEALSLAEMMPPPDVIAAARTGTTISAPATTASPAATEVKDGPQARPNIVFDYTHLGPKGAELFAKMVAVELARVVPDLRGEIAEAWYPWGP